ncbi:lipase [Kineosporia sp. NBRC 101677]|nr:lipase [Kineosporia sp. NBRC 101677]
MDTWSQLVIGAAEVERTERGLRLHRLPAWVRRQFADGQLMAMQAQPSGVRLAFTTTATRIDLVTHPVRLAYRGLDRPRGNIDVCIDGELVLRDPLTGGDINEVDLQSGQTTHQPGQPHHTHLHGLSAGDKRVEIWLPHNESVDLVDLSADAQLQPLTTPALRWVHHGSSISQGSNAAAPTQIWPVVAAQQLGLNLRNLGFGGSALVDPFMARVIRDSPADLISVKLGINVVNLDGMRSRTFVPAVHGFLDTIREGHPDVPLLVMSPIYCGIHENTPGPGAIDPASLGTGQVRFLATGREGDTELGRLTLSVIRKLLEDVVKSRSDRNLHYLDGTQLYGEKDAVQLPLPDALHPDVATHRLIGERFAKHVRSERPDGSQEGQRSWLAQA